MKKLVAENLNEYKELKTQDNLNEGIKETITDAIKNSADENKANGAIKASFKTTPQMIDWLVKQPIDKKIGFLKAGLDLLNKDPKMGYLKYVKNQQGQWVVGAVPVQGVNPASPK